MEWVGFEWGQIGGLQWLIGGFNEWRVGAKEREGGERRGENFIIVQLCMSKR